MNVTEKEFNYIKRHLTTQIINILMDENGYKIEDAINKVYTSPIYEKLSDPETGLFIQSPRYIMSYMTI